jgi:hypothetical protein
MRTHVSCKGRKVGDKTSNRTGDKSENNKEPKTSKTSMASDTRKVDAITGMFMYPVLNDCQYDYIRILFNGLEYITNSCDTAGNTLSDNNYWDSDAQTAPMRSKSDAINITPYNCDIDWNSYDAPDLSDDTHDCECTASTTTATTSTTTTSTLGQRQRIDLSGLRGLDPTDDMLLSNYINIPLSSKNILKCVTLSMLGNTHVIQNIISRQFASHDIMDYSQDALIAASCLFISYYFVTVVQIDAAFSCEDLSRLLGVNISVAGKTLDHRLEYKSIFLRCAYSDIRYNSETLRLVSAKARPYLLAVNYIAWITNEVIRQTRRGSTADIVSKDIVHQVGKNATGTTEEWLIVVIGHVLLGAIYGISNFNESIWTNVNNSGMSIWKKMNISGECMSTLSSYLKEFYRFV